MERLALAESGDRVARAGRQMLQPARDHLDGLDLGVHAVVDVAGEQLVGPLAAQHDLDVLRGQRRQEVQRHAARIGIRLVQMPLDARERRERLLVGQGFGRVVELEQLGKLAGLLGFVVRALAEADRIRVLGAGHRGHIAGIDAAGQERAHFDVGDLVRLDGITHRPVDRTDQFVEPLVAFAETLVVVPTHVHLAVAVDEVMPFRKLVHAFEEGLAHRRVLERHVRFERLGVELLDEVGVLQQALDLRRVHERAVHLGVVEGLDAEMVAGSEQLAPVLVPDHEREHAADLLQQVHAPLLIAVQQHFRVAFGGEGVARRDQFLTQRLVIVDLAVEGDDQRAVFVVDGLLAAAEVDDAQPPVPQRGVLVDVMALVIRPAMRDDVGHALEHRALDIDGHVVDESCDTTHMEPNSS